MLEDLTAYHFPFTRIKEIDKELGGDGKINPEDPNEKSLDEEEAEKEAAKLADKCTVEEVKEGSKEDQLINTMAAQGGKTINLENIEEVDNSKS